MIEAERRTPRWVRWVRVGAGSVALLGVLLAFWSVTAALGNTANREASAIQITQLYAEGCFYAICAIGVAVAAYIATRWD